MEKIIKNLRYYTAIFIGFFIIIIAKFISFFKDIRFGIIYSKRVGHLCHDVDAYLSQRSLKEISIFGLQKTISNRYIFECWKKKERIFFNKIGFYGYFFLKNFSPQSKMLIQWSELYPNYSTIMLRKKNFDTSKIDNKKELKNLIGTDFTPYICFHNRDDAYLKKIGTDGNDHGYRNYDFNDYTSSINFINSKNMKAVRIGRLTNSKFINQNNNFIDFTNSKSSDFTDVLLINNCEFLVASATGLSNIASILRKKIVLVNLIPFWTREMYQYTKGSIFLPKKIYCNTNKRLLKFSEIESLNYNIHEKKFFKKRNLSVINNTQDEICSSIKEMLYNCKKNNFEMYEKSKLHDRFWDSIADKKASKIIRFKLKINISDAFLKKNKSLI